jgi:transcriptional regulator with XRE-family HTH domain/ATP/maltotriose-dependent transcriptional regulator MalT
VSETNKGGNMRQQDSETIGERIRRLREEKGLRQRSLVSPGVTAAQVSRIESGKRNPSIKAVRQIARKLGVSPEFLETGVDFTGREELNLTLEDMELRIRLDPGDREIESDLSALVTQARREGESDIEARARASLGMALVGWGRSNEAIEQLETATTSAAVHPDVSPAVYGTLAHAYCDVGRPEDAMAVCEKALEEIDPENGVARTILSTELGQALSNLGDFEQAEQVLVALSDSVEQTDPYSRARYHWSLARVAAMQDKRRLALRHLHEAIALLKETEDTVRLARAHLLCASILLWGGKTGGVGRHLELARSLFPPDAESIDRGMLLGGEALLAAREHRFEEALASAEKALELLPEHELEQDAALYAKALTLASNVEYEAANDLFVQLIGLFEKGKLWRQAALVSRDRADMLRWAGKPYQSKEALERAEDYESRIGAEANQSVS